MTVIWVTTVKRKEIDTSTTAGTVFIGKCDAPSNLTLAQLELLPIWSIQKIVTTAWDTKFYLPDAGNVNATTAPNFKWSERNTLVTYL